MSFDPDTGVVGTPFQVTRYGGPDEHIPEQLASFEFDVAASVMAVPVRHRTGGIWSLRMP